MRVRPRSSAAAEADGVTAKEIRLLFENVPEPGHVGIAGVAAIRAFIEEAFVFGPSLAAIIMPSDEFPQQAAIIAEAISEAAVK